MKNNYFSIQNINKTATKQFFIAIIFIASAFFNNSFGQVNITSPSLTITGCAFPTGYSPLADIVIAESAVTDIYLSGSAGTLVLSAPANFEFYPNTGAVGFTPGDITAASITVSFNTLTVSLTGSTIANLDAITISGLMVKGVSGATGASNVTRTGGTSTISGDGTGTVHATFTSVLNNVTGGYISNPQTICFNGDPAPFTETVASTGSGTLTYQWKHSADSYAAILATTPTYDIPSGLISTTTYRRITTSTLGGTQCTANSTTDLTVTVLPLVTGGTISPAQTICSGSSLLTLSGGTGSGGDGTYTYLWQQSTTSPTTGFTAATNTNVATNYNPSPLSTTTWYRRKVASAGCSSNDTAAIEMTVEVPVVTNSSTFTTCSGAPMNIALTSNVPSYFSWTIGTITGNISGATGSTGSYINQTLTNLNNSTSGTIQYIITPTSISGSCTGTAFTITVTVNPAPMVSNSNSVSICSGTSVNTTLNASLPSTFSWTIGTITGGITGASANSGPAINQVLNNPGTASGSVQYLVTPTSSSGGCIGAALNITATVFPKPLVTNSPTISICDVTGPNITLTANVTSTFNLTMGTITGGITGSFQGGTVTSIYHILTNPSNSTAGTVEHIVTPTSSIGACLGDPFPITVTVNPTPTLSSSLTAAVCSGALFSYTPTSPVPGATFAWSRAVVGGISNTAANGAFDPSETLTNNVSSPINVTYIYTVSANSCTNSTNYNLITTVNPIPELSSTLFPPPICSGVPFNYTASSLTGGATFSWTRAFVAGISNPAASGSDSISEMLINTTSAPITVTYLYTTTANACSNIQNVTVIINPKPILSSVLIATVCSSSVFSYIPASLTNGATFAWTRAAVAGISNPAGTGIDSISEILYDTTTSPVSVSYVYTTSAYGCDSIETLIVTANPAPNVTNVTEDTICSGTDPNITLTADMPSTFAWTLGENPGGITGGSDSSGPTLNQILTNTDNSTTFHLQYLVTATSTSGTCSGNSSSIFIYVNPSPLASAGVNSTICSDSSVIIGGSPTASAGTGPYTYSWTPVSGLDNATASNPTANPAATTTYSVQVTDSLGCAASVSTIVVTVNPAPIVNAGADVSICIGNNITLYANGGTTYLWSNGSSADSITVSPTVNTTYNVMGTTNGCSHSDTVLVTVNLLPVVNGGSDTIICAGQSIVLSAIGNAPPYTWDNSVSDGVSFTPSTNTTYVVSGTLNGCSQFDTVLVTVNSVPVVNGGTDTIICAGQSTKLIANGNANSYTWNNGVTNGVPFTPSITNSYVVAGTSNGCSQFDTVLVTVNQIPSVNGGTDTTICTGQSTKLTANGNANSYTWDNGVTNGVPFTPSITNSYVVAGTSNGCSQFDTVLVTVNQIPSVNGGTDTTICTGQSTKLTANGNANSYTWDNGVTNGVPFTPSISNSYVVAGTSNGCSQFDTVLVTVNPIPSVNGGADTTICAGQSTKLTANGNANSYTWDNGVTNGVPFTPSISNSYVVAGTSNGCSQFDTVLVTVNPAPIANAGSDVTICIGDTATLTGLGGIAYVWTDGINSFNTPTILVTPIASTQYLLTVTDTSGCTDSDTAVVSVTPSKDIYGHARYSLGPVTSGMAVLYKYEQFQTRFDSVQFVPLNPSTGDYVFTNVNYGEYLVKVIADSVSYPNLINTYYGDEFLWDGDSVHVINHTCSSNTTLDSVTMVELTGTGGGIGLIIGQIIEGISFGRVEGEPIPGVDVNLGKNPGGIIATTNTDSTGHFTFAGVANGNYTIYVDIPGLGRDSTYTFTIDSTNNQFLNQNYIADSSSVFPNPNSTVGITNTVNASENKFIVYPNPVKGNTTIEYSILQMTDSKTTLEVTTVLGIKISSLVNANQQVGEYKYNFNPQNFQLNSGLYFITLTIDGKATTKRIIVIE